MPAALWLWQPKVSDSSCFQMCCYFRSSYFTDCSFVLASNRWIKYKFIQIKKSFESFLTIWINIITIRVFPSFFLSLSLLQTYFPIYLIHSFRLNRDYKGLLPFHDPFLRIAIQNVWLNLHLKAVNWIRENEFVSRFHIRNDFDDVKLSRWKAQTRTNLKQQPVATTWSYFRSKQWRNKISSQTAFRHPLIIILKLIRPWRQVKWKIAENFIRKAFKSLRKLHQFLHHSLTHSLDVIRKLLTRKFSQQ